MMPVQSIRIFKTVRPGERNLTKERFTVRSVNKFEVGLIIWDIQLKKVTFTSTIQSFSWEALQMIADFMKSLEDGNVDLVLNENEVILYP
ncbi:MAG TPA: hypothetical protein VGF75_08130 [Candidatus Saccharimonadales bacterium]|jgi:hypothetical protein